MGAHCGGALCLMAWDTVAMLAFVVPLVVDVPVVVGGSEPQARLTREYATMATLSIDVILTNTSFSYV
jgi:hypothetical protein